MLTVSLDFNVICLNRISPEKYLLLFCVTSLLEAVQIATVQGVVYQIHLHESEGFVLHRFDGKCSVTMINFAICIAMRNK